MFIYNPTSETNKIPAASQTLGGSPLYIQDLCNLQETTQIFSSQFRDYNIVLSGMLVDTIDVTTQTCSLTEGYFQINGIVYYFPATTGIQYPFEIITTGYDDDTRTYANGSDLNLGRIYDGKFTINNSFPLGFDNIGYPTKYANVTVNAIYFDPYTMQRLSFLQQNHWGTARGDCKLMKFDPIITHTETGRAISNGSLSNIIYDTVDLIYKLKWNYASWTYNLQDADSYIRSTPTVAGGTGSVTLTKDNIPTHTHEKGSISTNLGGQHNHNIHTHPELYVGGDTVQNLALGKYGTDSVTYSAPVLPDGQHVHTMVGSTENGALDGLRTAPFSINIEPLYAGGLKLIRKNIFPYKFYTTSIVSEINKCWEA